MAFEVCALWTVICLLFLLLLVLAEKTPLVTGESGSPNPWLLAAPTVWTGAVLGMGWAAIRPAVSTGSLTGHAFHFLLGLFCLHVPLAAYVVFRFGGTRWFALTAVLLQLAGSLLLSVWMLVRFADP